LRRGGWGGEFRIEPLELLESFLVDDLGAVLLISRGRGLPNDLVTSALVIEDDGLTREHEESYDSDRRQRRGEPVSRSRPDSEVPTKKPADIPREQSRKLSCKESNDLAAARGRFHALAELAG